MTEAPTIGPKIWGAKFPRITSMAKNAPPMGML
jgi:hypothetical protein